MNGCGKIYHNGKKGLLSATHRCGTNNNYCPECKQLNEVLK